MTISKDINEKNINIAVEGRIDTVTAPDFEREIFPLLTGNEKLTLDLKKLEYISSAGLRIILSIQKKLSPDGKLVITNVNDTVYEVFEVTGFAEILIIQQ